VNNTFTAFFKQYRDLVESRMRERLVKPAPVSLYDPMRYAVESGGKRLRPVLALMTCRAVGGEVETALDAAIAIELVHNFSLVHDDIMDRDDLRRGRPTVYKKWDESVAILAGDALLIEAYRALDTLPPDVFPTASRRFSDSILEICEGQALDKEFESSDQILTETYFEMIGKKTGRLFGLACELGALLGGGDRDQQTALSIYGERLGFAFQIQDDLLDVTADEEILGKDIGSDLQQGKKTFLFIRAWEQASPPDRALLHSLKQNTSVTPAQIREVIDLFDRTGSLKAAQKEIDLALADARNALSNLPASEAQTWLMQMIETVATRNA
jgi:geranylgeranyl diphosphate synthase type II